MSTLSFPITRFILKEYASENIENLFWGKDVSSFFVCVKKIRRNYEKNLPAKEKTKKQSSRIS